MYNPCHNHYQTMVNCHILHILKHHLANLTDHLHKFIVALLLLKKYQYKYMNHQHLIQSYWLYRDQDLVVLYSPKFTYNNLHHNLAVYL